ncbi:MATE family efflux transporter [Neobacillus sp. NPDC093182]|uniref:MATE family efflux transporter n=1 Tax=Neobacillus sp. NPDC093182 TaxID=3364297 RepID=UPI0038027658
MQSFLRKFKNLQGANKTILLNIFLSFIIKGGSLILSLFTLPAYMRYFDNNIVLGTWLTIVSLLTWIINFDLGIGNGLRNKLVVPLMKKDNQAIKKYISSAYISLSVIALIIAIVGYYILGFFNWNEFFGVKENYISNIVLLATVRIVLIGTLLQFVLRIITSILYAMQKSFVPNLLQLCTTILLLIFIYGGLVLGVDHASVEENLIRLAYANIVTVNLPLLVTSIVVFGSILKGCLPRLSLFEKKYAQEVMKIGIAFLWLQIMYMLINNTNEFFITWFIGAENVVEYQIYFKLFTLLGTLAALALTPIWSAVTKAKAENNYKWINKLNNTLMLVGVFGIICEFLMIPFLQPIINLWLGEDAIQVNYLYSLIFAVSGGLFLWNRIISTMSNGFGELKVQMIFLTLGAVLNFPLAYFFSMLFNSYISIVIANIVSMLPYCIIQPIWMKRYLNKKCMENY